MSTEPADPRASPGPGGFTLVDAGALVVGAAVASAHMRRLVDAHAGVSSTLFAITFLGVSITATGPVLLLIRRATRRDGRPPGAGGRIWGILGAPWLMGVVLASPGVKVAERSASSYDVAMPAAIGVASVWALVIVGRSWVAADPALDDDRGPLPWTERVGLALGVAWPLQSGFGLMLLS